MRISELLFLAGTALAVPTPQQGGKGNGTCNSAKTAQLVGGIQANLDIQAMELKGVQTLQRLAASNTSGKALAGDAVSDFQSTQQSVLVIQQKGIDIRAGNQKLASDLGSPSQKGLAMVAMAQVMEMMQVKSLSGSGANDMKTLETLVKEVQDGTKQNMLNMQDAQSQCK